MQIAVLREAGGLGDVVMTEPALRGLRREHPQAEIWFAGLPEYEELVRLFPRPPDVYLAVARAERRDRDGPVDGKRWHYLQHVEAAELIVDLFCPAFQHERRERNRTRLSRVESFCRAAGVTPSAPALRLRPEDRQWARGYLAASGWWGDEGKPLVALAPWAYGRRRMWPLKKWEALARILANRGMTPLVFHAFPRPVREVEGIKAAGLPLPKVAALLSRCDLAVTNDSGILHLAAAVGTESLSLWGSTNPRVTLAQYPRARFIHRPESPARPARCQAPCYSMRGACDYAACRSGCRILEAVAVDEVRAEIEESLKLQEPGKGG